VILFGKNVLLPLIGYTLFAALAALSKNLHNFIGPIFVACLFIIFGTFVRDNFWRRYDWTWIRHFGGLMSGHDVPSHRFNAGEKLWFWLGILLIGGVVAGSGLILDFPNFNQSRNTMQVANVIHIVGSCLFIMMGSGTSTWARSAWSARTTPCAPATSTRRGRASTTNTGTTTSRQASFPRAATCCRSRVRLTRFLPARSPMPLPFVP
jgi:hypothetical protein